MSQYSFMDVSGQKFKLVIVSALVALVIVVWFWPPLREGVPMLPMASASTGIHGAYTTNFPHPENPISEGGKWLNGQSDGLDWTNVRTTPGFAFGTELGGKRPEPEKYDDSAALLTGAWGPNQTVQATVHRVNKDDDTTYQEVELRLRSALAPHNSTGYEVMFRCSKSPKAYVQVARWDGILGAFMYLKQAEGSQYGVADGDVVKASMIGKVITVYINGVQVVQTSDYLFTGGNPGIGFYLDGTTGVNSQCGFSSFSATDK